MQNRRQAKSISLVTAGVITTISITLVLFLLGGTFLLWFTGSGLSSYLKEKQEISVELAENVDAAHAAKIQAQLAKNPYIKSTQYISKEEVKTDLIEQLGGNPDDVIGYGWEKSYIDIAVKAEYMNPDSIGKVISSLKGKDFNLVDSVIYQTEDIELINSNLSTLVWILFLITIILVIISFVLIRSIIQLNIYSKRFLINTMQLVGATNGFIRKPFMWRMVFCGIIAALVANLALFGLVYYVGQIFPESQEILKTGQLMIVGGLVLVSGILIPILATISAVNRYLRMTTNKIYRA